ATVTDPDGAISNATYQFEGSSDGSTWTTVQNTASNSSTQGYADAGLPVRVTAPYDDADGHNAVTASNSATIADHDQAGSLALGTAEEGVALTATVTDPDGAISNATYQFEVSSDG